jgi:hypothetical protein
MRLFYRYVLILGISILSINANAQVLKPLPFSYYQLKNKAFNKLCMEGADISSIDRAVSYSSLRLSPTFSFKYTLPKRAIFCRMEDLIYSKLNFWVKFRMGTDDRYSN